MSEDENIAVAATAPDATVINATATNETGTVIAPAATPVEDTIAEPVVPSVVEHKSTLEQLESKIEDKFVHFYDHEIAEIKKLFAELKSKI